MKKILGLTVAALLVMGLVGGGTWAYFSDVETSTGNILTAGTLDLTPDTATIWVITYDVTDDVAPGWDNSLTPDSWTLTNSGTIDGDLTINIGAIDNEDVTREEPETDDLADTLNGDLGANLDVVFWADLDSSGTCDGNPWVDGGAMNGYMDAGEGEVMYEGKLDSMPDDYPLSGKIALIEAGHIAVYFDASIATTVGNCIMSDSSTFDITFNLEQTHP